MFIVNRLKGSFEKQKNLTRDRIRTAQYSVVDYLAHYSRSVPTKKQLDRYVSSIKNHQEFDNAVRVKEFSMLHTEVLLLLRYLARRSAGPVVEFGAYVGGSTVMLATSLMGRSGKVLISVEPGGAHSHPTIPTDDIFGDLENNLSQFGCRERVHLIRGFSYQDETREEIERLTDGELIGMLCIDSDGQVESDIERYSDLMADGCILVLDDYSSKRAPEKQTLIKQWVEDAEAAGKVSTLGVYGWGTWFGVYRGAAAD